MIFGNNDAGFIIYSNIATQTMESFTDLGYFGMFVASFLAATILPLGSEPVLAGLLYADLNPSLLLIVATVGNTLGGLTNYLIGMLGKLDWIQQKLNVKPKTMIRAKVMVRKYGVWSALLCWLPVVGDPIAIVFGLFRVNLVWVSLLMLIGKLGRYALLVYVLM